MGEPLVLVFDVGTQSTRAFLFNKKGDAVCSYKVETEPFYAEKVGYAEKETEEYWSAVVSASNGLKSKAGDLWDDIIAMSITSIRGTYAFLDENIKPIRPTITWLDQRLAKPEQKFPLISTLLYKIAGMYRTALKQRRMSPSTWMKENQPEIWAKTKYFTLVSAYLNYKLSGRLCDCTASQASRLPYNYKKERWQKHYELTCVVYNVEREKLCELVKPGDIIGKISKEVSEITGIPEGLDIIATGSDKACETLGTGALRADTASISFGTTATLQITTKKYVEPQKYMPAYNSVVRGYFNPEIQIFRGFWMVTWFKKQFGHEEVRIAEDIGVTAEQILDKSLTEIPAGSNGLMLQPYWAPGLKIPEAKGTIIGFNDCHTKAHVYKSIVEGIGYALYEGLVYLEKKSRQKINKISVSGGGSQSDSICKITADMFGRPVYRVQTCETSGLGAAMIAFVTKGEFKDFEDCNKAMVHFKDEFKPNMQNHKIYKNLFNKVYKDIYPQLQPLYLKLYEIVNEETNEI